MKKLLVILLSFILIIPFVVNAQDQCSVSMELQKEYTGVDIVENFATSIDYFIYGNVLTVKEDGDNFEYYKADTNKLLFIRNTKGFFIADGVDESDNINFEIPLLNHPICSKMNATFSFKNDEVKKSDIYVVDLTNKMKFDERSAFFGEIMSSVGLDSFFEEEKFIYSKDNKNLIISSELFIEPAEGLTKKDNIIYTITDDDRNYSKTAYGYDIYENYNKIFIKFAEQYTFLEGQGQKFDRSGDSKLSFRVDGEKDNFVKLFIDGKEVNKLFYDVTSGSTVVTFNELGLKWINNLSKGEHTITYLYNDGLDVSAQFTLENNIKVAEEKKEKNPDTFDVISIALAIIISSLLMMAILGVLRKTINRY